MSQPLDYSGHVPADVDQYGRDTDRRIDKSKPVDSVEVRGYGLRSDDFQGHTPNPVDSPPVRVARDKTVYTRQQKGHSLVLHILLGGLVLWIPAIYYSVSPNHFWHA